MSSESWRSNTWWKFKRLLKIKLVLKEDEKERILTHIELMESDGCDGCWKQTVDVEKLLQETLTKEALPQGRKIGNPY